QRAEIHRHRLGPSEQQASPAHQLAHQQNTKWHQDGADWINVLDRVEGDPARQVSGVVAEHARHIAVRGLVEGEREDDRDRVDRDGLYEGIHGGIVAGEGAGRGLSGLARREVISLLYLYRFLAQYSAPVPVS